MTAPSTCLRLIRLSGMSRAGSDSSTHLRRRADDLVFDRLRRPERRSLERSAERIVDDALRGEGVSREARRFRRAVTWSRHQFGRPVFVLLLLLGITGLTLLASPPTDPSPILPSVPDLSRTLSTLWQVIAAALALIVAATVLAYQAQLEDVRELNDALRLEERLIWAVAALVPLGGLVLISGESTEAFWPLAWGVGLGFLVLISLPFTVLAALRGVERGRVVERRLRSSLQAVQQDLRAEMKQRVAWHLLEDRAGEAGVETTIIGEPPDGAEVILAQRGGEVRDIDLVRLRRLGSGGGDQTPVVAVQLCQSIREGRPLVWLASGGGISSARHLVRVGQPRDLPDLDDIMRRLRREAFNSLERFDSGSFDRILDTYRELLTERSRFEAAIRRRYPPAAASGGTLFGRRWDDSVRSDIYDLFDRALEGSRRDVGFALIYFPVGVAKRSVERGSARLAAQMLDLFRSLFLAMLQRRGSTFAESARANALVTIYRFLDMQLPAMQAPESDQDARDTAGVVADYGFVLLGRLVLDLVTADVPSQGLEVLEFLHDQADEFGEADQLRALRDRLARLEEGPEVGEQHKRVLRRRVQLAEAADERRARLRATQVEILAWGLERLRDRPEGAWKDVCRALLQQLPPIDRLLADVDALFANEGVLWERLISPSPSVKASFVDSAGPVARALAAVALAHEKRRSLPPTRGVEVRMQVLQQGAEDILGRSDVLAALSLSQEAAHERGETYREALEQAAASSRQRERERVAAAKLDPDRVELVRAAVAAAFDEARRVSILTRVEAPRGQQIEVAVEQRVRLSRANLVESAEQGMDGLGTQSGRGLAAAELTFVIRRLADMADLLHLPRSDRPAPRFAAALEQLRASEFIPDLVVISDKDAFDDSWMDAYHFWVGSIHERGELREAEGVQLGFTEALKAGQMLVIDGRRVCPWVSPLEGRDALSFELEDLPEGEPEPQVTLRIQLHGQLKHEGTEGVWLVEPMQVDSPTEGVPSQASD